MKVTITGGAGYIGSTLIPMLLRKGHQVHVVDSLVFGGHTLLSHFINPNFSFANVDVRNKSALATEVKDADVSFISLHWLAILFVKRCLVKPKR